MWLLELARQFMSDEGSEDAAHDYDHLVRVIALAEKIQASEGGDLPTIWADVALHDIGQERERSHGGDHALIGAALAAELLKDTPFPQQYIPAVQQAIQEHRMTGGVIPQTLEGRILNEGMSDLQLQTDGRQVRLLRKNADGSYRQVTSQKDWPCLLYTSDAADE